MIDRRTLLLSAAALGLAGRAGAATLDFVPGLLEERLAAGETVFLDFFATWCSTCAAQNRVLTELRLANPAYDAAITFIRVDWDTFRNHNMVRTYNVPRRSTLIVLKGDAEIGRLVAVTGTDEIRALLDAALAA